MGAYSMVFWHLEFFSLKLGSAGKTENRVTASSVNEIQNWYKSNQWYKLKNKIIFPLSFKIVI